MTDSKKNILWRAYLIYFLILIFGISIIAKIIIIQVKEGDRLIKKAQTQELKAFNIEANRGNIMDVNHKLLATSVPVFEVRFDVSSPHISNELLSIKIDSISAGLSKILNKSRNRIKKSIQRNRKKGNRYLLIGRNISYRQLKEIKQLPIFRRGKYKGGLICIQKTRRSLPNKSLAARTIGYAIEDADLYVGLEGAYADVLKGTNGSMMMRRINHGDWVPVHDDNEIEPCDGRDIVTTIDVEIQDIAETALLNQLTINKAFQGCAVVMEVETGNITAIANLRYDSTQKKFKESYNYALGESIEPGSTFKLASIICALEDGKVKLTDSLFTGEGYTSYYNRPMRDVHKIKNGRITVRDAFEHSSNVGISRIIYESYKDNPSEFIDGLYELSLNKPLNTKIAGEGKPFIKHPSNKKIWYGTSLPWMSIGYELTITPLQTLTLYNSIANDGVMVKPIFIKEIREGTAVIEKFDTEIINKSIASQSTVDSAKSLLEGVVIRGTARRIFKNSKFAVAGKTGTAQIAINGKYNKSDYNGTFVGYFPADDPKYSMIVVVSRPKAGKYYGGSVAAPAFKEIAENIYATKIAIKNCITNNSSEFPVSASTCYCDDLKSIYTNTGLGYENAIPAGSQWIKANGNTKEKTYKEINFSKKTIPNVVGMKAKDAVYLLENRGLTTKISGRGKVIKQSIKPGKPVSAYKSISLQLSTY